MTLHAFAYSTEFHWEKEVIDAVKGLSPDRFRVVMGVLMDVKVQPVGKGHWAGANRFDPERIKVVWHD